MQFSSKSGTLFGFRVRSVLGILFALLSATSSAQAQLNADTATSTIFMMEYNIWWSNDGASGWSPLQYDAAQRDNFQTTETSNLTGGGYGIVARDANGWEVVTAKPSLNAAGFSATSSIPNLYYSTEGSVIRYHLNLISQLGVQAIMPDMTNNAEKLFSASSPDRTFDGATTRLSDGVSNANTAFVKILQTLEEDEVPAVYVVPFLGANASSHVAKDNGYSPFQRSIMFMVDAFDAHPTRSVTYGGKILMTVFHAVGGTDWITTTDTQLSELSSDYKDRVTLRHVYGFLGDQPDKWATPRGTPHPPYTQAMDGVWTNKDRLYENGSDKYRTYTLAPGSDSAECTTVCVTSQPNAGAGTPLITRRGGEIINESLSLVREIHPKFAMINEFNGFMSGDSAFGPDARPEIEPVISSQGGDTTYQLLKTAIAQFRTYEGGGGKPRFNDLRARGLVKSDNSGWRDFVMGLTFDPLAVAPQRITLLASGPGQARFFSNPAILSSDPSLYLISPSLTASKSGASGTASTSNVSAFGARTFQNSFTYLNYLSRPATPTTVALQPTESAITADIDPNGSTVFYISDSTNSGKVAHARLMLTDKVSASRVTNFSVRSRVASTSDCVAIIGFSVDMPMQVLIRGAGPSMIAWGFPSSELLLNPKLDLFRDSTLVATSNDVVNEPPMKTTLQNYYGGGWPVNDLECGIIYNCFPGFYYTAVLSNQSGASQYGVGMIDLREY